MMSVALVAPTLLGLGWPLVARWRAEPAQRLLSAVCLSLIAQYLVGWLVYTLDMPVASVFALVPLAIAGNESATYQFAMTVWSSLAFHAATVAGNVLDTVVPHFLRSLDRSAIRQSSPLGFVRDWWFMCYQLNLLMIFGSTGWLVVLAAGRQSLRRLPAGHTASWLAAIGLVILLGIGCHSGRDHWGVSHICLQPLVLAGLSCVAGCWSTLTVLLRRLYVGGAVIDLVVGILLHYSVQGFVIDRWLMPGRPLEEIVQTYNSTTSGNFLIKHAADWTFVGDTFAKIQFIPVALALTILAVSLWDIRRRSVAADAKSMQP